MNNDTNSIKLCVNLLTLLFLYILATGWRWGGGGGGGVHAECTTFPPQLFFCVHRHHHRGISDNCQSNQKITYITSSSSLIFIHITHSRNI
jgi:hypothetical protein